jgi:valyl-tRNA synthetase
MSEQLSAKFVPGEIEEKWYNYWENNGYFNSTPDVRPAYSIVIPPPNVTGVLHMGHMLNNTIQDILIRKARMSGYNACWVPGTDHASIATEAKVVKMLRERGIKKSDLTREQFLDYAWEWKEEYGGIILQQLRKLGATCDWSKTSFTMDPIRSEGVIKVFVDLYNKDKLYRKKRMVNWDPEAKTVLSNEEVIYALENSKLYKVKYKVVGSDEYIIVATTRPETIPGDTAVAVHPEDERYLHLKDKMVIVPLIGREVPVIFDTYVDREFGTGALKVTPAHDTNDFEIGERHQLDVIDVFEADGTMSKEAGIYIGEDRFIVRKKFAKDLDAAGLIESVEEYKNNVGRSERTNAIIEPRLSLQWYVNMAALAEPALEAVMTDDIEFFPKNQKNTYKHWMENIRDWCISRQLWWGHRIPAWYYKDDSFIALNADEALKLAKVKYPDITIEQLKQDEDVLDTWFSSWLWPITVFDGFNDPKTLAYYYPTSVLVTGWDIIFLWVARMIMAGFEWQNEKPFKHVYFTGMVRDKLRRKMSKSLGNSPDALELIANFGADGVRFGMLSSSPAGGDLLFDEKYCEQGRNFSNKIWNALKLIKGWEAEENLNQPSENRYAVDWINERLSEISAEIDKDFNEYRLSEALVSIYTFVWDDFCSWYLEMIKPAYGSPIDHRTYEETIEIFSKICSLLHPFMPFITEEIWHKLKVREEGEDCILSVYPNYIEYSDQILGDMNTIKNIVTNLRDIRNKKGIKPREEIAFYAINSPNVKLLFQKEGVRELLLKLGIINDIQITDTEFDNTVGFVLGTDKFGVILNKVIDAQAEITEKTQELEYQLGFVKSVESKLNNEKFVSGAPQQVVEKEKQKLADGLARIKILKEEIEKLGRM